VGYCGTACNNNHSKHIYYIYLRLKLYSVFSLVVGRCRNTMASLSVSRSGRLERVCAVRLRDVGPNRWQHRVVGGEMFGRQVAVRSALHGVLAGRSVFLLDDQERWRILMSSLLGESVESTNE
jgi:hypothetical protein